MRVLQANKYFFKGGGADVVFFDTIAGLRARGHEVAEFAMQNPKNYRSDYAPYFAPPLPEKLIVKQDLLESWRIFRQLFYSAEVEKRLTSLIVSSEPQVAHLHNVYHHLSASLFTTLRQRKIPTVLTLHDVFPLCPNHSLLHNEHMAEELFKNKLYNCVRYKCIDNRFLPSLAATLEAYYYRWRGIWQHIDAFICPSRFMKDKMMEWGYPERQLKIVLNPYDPPTTAPPLGNRIVYLGRIHIEKGIKVFLEACRFLRQYPITIAGSGPADEYVDSFIKKNNLLNIERLRWVEGPAWNKVMASARTMVVPSIFYENCSIAILESLGNGRLVVATNRGGNPEMIVNGQTGLLVKPEDPDDLVRVLKEAAEFNDARIMQMANQAQREILPKYRRERYFNELEQVYKEVIE